MEIQAPPIESAVLVQCESPGDWLVERTKGVGGSDVAAIVGLSPYRSAYDVWQSKVAHHDVEEGRADTNIGWGKLIESAVVEAYYRVTLRGVAIDPKNSLWRHKDKPHHQYSADFHVRCDDEWALGEAKCVGRYMQDAWGDDAVPEYYYLQAQWGMHVLGYKRTDLAAFFGIDRPLNIKPVQRDDEVISMLVDEVDRFWDHVRTSTPPPIDVEHPRAHDTLRLRYPTEHPGLVVELGARAIEIVDALDQVKERATVCDNDAKRLKAELMVLMGEAEEGALPDGRRVTWRTVERKGYVVQPSASRQLRVLNARKAKK